MKFITQIEKTSKKTHFLHKKILLSKYNTMTCIMTSSVEESLEFLFIAFDKITILFDFYLVKTSSSGIISYEPIDSNKFSIVENYIYSFIEENTKFTPDCLIYKQDNRNHDFLNYNRIVDFANQELICIIQDQLHEIIEDNNITHLSDLLDKTLNNTSVCVYCEELFFDDEVSLTEVDDQGSYEYYCDDCIEKVNEVKNCAHCDNLFYANDSDEEHCSNCQEECIVCLERYSDSEINIHNICHNCESEGFQKCDDCEEATKNLIYLDNFRKNVCNECSENYIECENCSDYVYSEDVEYHENSGLSYCYSCFHSIFDECECCEEFFVEEDMSEELPEYCNDCVMEKLCCVCGQSCIIDMEGKENPKYANVCDDCWEEIPYSKMEFMFK